MSFLDDEGRLLSLFTVNDTEVFEQSAGVNWLVRGAKWLECFLLRWRFHRGKRDRMVGVVRRDIFYTPVVFTDDAMLDTPICIAMLSGLYGTNTAVSHPPLSARLWVLL